MGKPFRVEAVLPENARSYMLERDSAAFRSLLAKVLKLGTVEMTDTWKEGESTFVRLVTRPDFANWVPKGVQGQANSKAIEFHDVLEYNPAFIQHPPFRINVRTESPFLGDKLDVRLELMIEEVDENTCRQVLQGHIRVNMAFGVGRIVESIVKDSLQNTYKKLPEIVRRWQAFRAEALANGNAKELLSGRPPVGQSISWIRAEVLQILQSPIEAEAIFPLASPTAVVSPDDLSQFSSDEQAVPAAPAAPAAPVAAPAAPAAAPAAEEPLEICAGAGAGAGPPAEAGEEQRGEDAQAAAEPLEPSVSGLRSSYTVYYDASDLLEEDAVSSTFPGAEDRAADGRRQQQQQQRSTRSQWPAPLVLDIPQPSGEAAELGEGSEVTPPGGAGAAAPDTSGPRHRRNISVESGDSSADALGYSGASGPTSPFQKRPNSQKSWRGFNDSYEQWTAYWDIMGVKHMAPREPPSGPLAYLYRAQESLRGSASTVLMTLYLFAMRKGLVTVQPNQDGRYAGKAPRLNLERLPVQQGPRQQPLPRPSVTGAPGAAAGGPLHRQQSAPAAQQLLLLAGPQQGQQAQHGQRALVGAEVSMSLPGEGPKGEVAEREVSAASRYGSAERVAALVAGYTHKRLSGSGSGLSGHRRAVSVDSGTAAAARKMAAEAEAQALAAPGGSGGEERHEAGSGQQALQRTRRRSTAIPRLEPQEEEEEDRVYPPARFSCLPVCWHRGGGGKRQGKAGAQPKLAAAEGKA